MGFSKVELEQIMSEVSLAPSAHNSQPAKWRYASGGFYLSSDDQRRLPVADPSDHDLLLSLGAQIEGLEMSLNSRGQKITNIEKMDQTYKISVVSSEDKASELYSLISKRKTYRGFYKSTKPLDEKTRELFSNDQKYFLVSDKESIKSIAKMYDQASLDFFRDQGYTKELYSWLRFNKSDEKWHKDGLNDESMSLNAVESFGARQVLKPKVFKALDRIGLASMLVSEAPKVKTSSFILCLLKDKSNNNHIKLGRFFYRSWLKATLSGYNLCPLSNIVDHPNYKSKLESMLNFPDGLELFKIFRAGPEPSDKELPGRYRVDLDQYFNNEEES